MLVGRGHLSGAETDELVALYRTCARHLSRVRTAALAAEGRALITVAVGLTAALAVAGLIEAFVTPAPIPWLVKIAIGAGALALLWAYTLILGRSAVAAGSTGDLEEDEAGYVQPEAG